MSGFHGTNLADGALGTLIAELKAGRIATPALLLIERQDRFGRRATCQTLITLFSDLLGRDCDLYHLNQGRLYSTDLINQDFGALVTLAAEVHSAHHYSAVLSQRSAVAHQKARDQIAAGKAVRLGWAPAWIEHGPEGWVMNDYATVIRRLLDLMASGLGYIATANQLNAEGLLAPRGKRWTGGGITHIVQSAAIAGGRPLQRRTGQVVWDYFPALLERDAWLALLADIKGRSAAYTAPSEQDACWFIGQGITTCASCGQVVGQRTASYVVQGQAERQRARYVRCRGRQSNSCTEPAVRLPEVVAHVLTRLQPAELQLLLEHRDDDQTTALRSTVEGLDQRLKGAQAALAKAEQEMGALMASGEATTAAVMARAIPAMEAKVLTLEQELQQARLDLSAATSQPSVDELGEPLVNLQHAFALGQDSAEQRRAVNRALRRLGVRIVLRPSQREVGMAVGSREPQWQPLLSLDRAALFDGLTGWNVGRDGELIVEPQTVGRAKG